MTRLIPALVDLRKESPWCGGEEGRLHVTEERPTKYGAALICKHCGRLCAARVETAEAAQ